MYRLPNLTKGVIDMLEFSVAVLVIFIVVGAWIVEAGKTPRTEEKEASDRELEEYAEKFL